MSNNEALTERLRRYASTPGAPSNAGWNRVLETMSEAAERIAELKEQLLRDDDSYQDLETRLREEIDRANRMAAERDALKAELFGTRTETCPHGRPPGVSCSICKYTPEAAPERNWRHDNEKPRKTIVITGLKNGRRVTCSLDWWKRERRLRENKVWRLNPR